jgi:hypothetical protein
MRGLRGDRENRKIRCYSRRDELVYPNFFADSDGSTFLL